MVDNMKLIPKQFKMSTKIGGFLTIFNQMMVIYSTINFLMITRLNYYNSDDIYFQTYFPTYFSFMVTLFFVGLIGMIFTYTVAIPSIYKFTQEQSVKDGRSPTYDKIIEVEKKIDILMENKK